MSVICSGIVCFGLVRWAEVEGANRQLARSVENCEPIQGLARALDEVAKDVADNATKPDVEKRWRGYSEKFSAVYPPGAATCEETFPKQKLFWVFTP